MKARATLIKVLESCNTSAVRGGLQARRDVFPPDKPLNIYRGAGPMFHILAREKVPLHEGQQEILRNTAGRTAFGRRVIISSKLKSQC